MKELSAKERTIYEVLGDEESKRVFQARKHYKEDAVADFSQVFRGRPLKGISLLGQLLRNHTFICYGANEGCRSFFRNAAELGIAQNCLAIFDRNPELHGTALYGHIISPFDLSVAEKTDFIVVTPLIYSVSMAINEFLLSQGVDDSKILHYCDYQAINDVDMYFDDIILKRLGENEIFVDGGCFDFSSSALFLKHCPKAKKIYAFEPNPSQLPIIRKSMESTGYNDVEMVNGALWSCDRELCFRIDSVASGSRVVNHSNETVRGFALDHIVKPDERITYIKMDVEGAELEALSGAAKVIKCDKPKLAISIYHKANDYVDIPAFIGELAPEYRMYMRHYTTSYLESVLYCVM